MPDEVIDVQSRLREIDSSVMGGLTPFQQSTVEHIAALYKSGQNRVLVADEVGLGKTLIAKGVISKIALMRKEAGDDLVKIVYICSNASIAAQNISKLSIDGDIKLARAELQGCRCSISTLRWSKVTESFDSDTFRLRHLRQQRPLPSPLELGR